MIATTRRCVISLGIDAAKPANHPSVLYQDYGRGLARIRRDVARSRSPVDVLTWTDSLPEGASADGMAYLTFKPFCFAEALARGYEQILWLDASVRLAGDVQMLFRHIDRHGHLFVSEIHSVGRFCTDDALATLGISREESFVLPSCWACVLGLDMRRPPAREFLERWCELAADGITFPGPKWSGVLGYPATASADPRVHGHRYDQTAASVLAHRLGMRQWVAHEDHSKLFCNDRFYVRAMLEELGKRRWQGPLLRCLARWTMPLPPTLRVELLRTVVRTFEAAGAISQRYRGIG